MLALVAGIAFSAFTVTGNQPKSADQLWYEFTGGNENVSSSYQLLGDGTVAPECTTGSERCAVKATEDPQSPGHPDLSDSEIEIRDKN